MISLKELAKYEHMDAEIRIVCTDGQILIGIPDSVDLEDESGIDEPGITICTTENVPVVIGLSEIQSINILGDT